jgi:hypothetical protein
MCDQHKFVFEFDKAFNHQLIEKFEASPAHTLSEDVAPAEPGVYALYWRGGLVYAGKALEIPLRRRLAEHARKIRSRQRVEPQEVTCRFLEIEGSWFVRAAEDALITYYAPEWIGSGFGGHDPGSGRPGIRPCKWDQDFPLRADYVRLKRPRKSAPKR